jgi:hypothetical protein
MFEITESNVIANIGESLVKINMLKDQGATFSLGLFIFKLLKATTY